MHKDINKRSQHDHSSCKQQHDSEAPPPIVDRTVHDLYVPHDDVIVRCRPLCHLLHRAVVVGASRKMTGNELKKIRIQPLMEGASASLACGLGGGLDILNASILYFAGRANVGLNLAKL